MKEREKEKLDVGEIGKVDEEDLITPVVTVRFRSTLYMKIFPAFRKSVVETFSLFIAAPA